MVYIDKIQHSQVLDLKTEVPIEEEQMLSKTYRNKSQLLLIMKQLPNRLKQT